MNMKLKLKAVAAAAALLASLPLFAVMSEISVDIRLAAATMSMANGSAAS